jgi:signal peptidase I
MDSDHKNNPEPLETPVKEQSRGSWKDALSTIGIIILAPVVALFLTAFVFQSYQVDGPSMEPTLSDGDRLIVTKTDKTWAKITGSDYKPERYDIIIFNQSGSFEGAEISQKQLVKRVIGVPGDRVVIEEGVIRVFNAQNPDGFLVDAAGPEGANIGTTSGHVNVSVPSGELYVVGDNRDNSMDSRNFGTVRAKDVIGRLALRIYPFDDFQKF